MSFKIRRDYCLWAIWLVVLLETGVFYSIIPILHSSSANYLAVFITCIAAAYSIFWLKKNKKLSEIRYINIYVITYLLCIFGSFIYTCQNGSASLGQTVSYAKYYLIIVLIYPLIYLNAKYENGIYELKNFANVTFFMTIVRAINCLVTDATDNALFPELIAGQIRNGHSSTNWSSLDYLLVIYLSYMLIKAVEKRKKRKIYIFALSLSWVAIYVVRFIGSRMVILAMLVAAVGLFVAKKRSAIGTILTIMVVVVGTIAFVNTSYFKNLSETITTASEDDIEEYKFSNTASVRLVAMVEANKKLKGNPYGMGMIYYGTEAFDRVFKMGSNDDLGYIGNYFTFGVFALPFIILLLFRNIYVLQKSYKKKDFELFLSLFLFLCVSGISISIFDHYRVFGVPFALYVLELYKTKDEEVIEEIA